MSDQPPSAIDPIEAVFKRVADFVKEGGTITITALEPNDMAPTPRTTVRGEVHIDGQRYGVQKILHPEPNPWEYLRAIDHTAHHMARVIASVRDGDTPVVGVDTP